MRNAFLVSDEDLKSLRSGEPWSIELQGQAIFMHESVLRLLQNGGVNANHNLHLDNEGRPLTCDQVGCPRSMPSNAFASYAARQGHRARTHGIQGEYFAKHQKRSDKLKIGQTPKLPPPTLPPSSYKHGESYNYQEFDAKGICGIGECTFKSKKVHDLHFHRSLKHGIRGVNWHRNHPGVAARKVGRPRKET
jgi:hypothetical protein